MYLAHICHSRKCLPEAKRHVNILCGVCLTDWWQRLSLLSSPVVTLPLANLKQVINLNHTPLAIKFKGYLDYYRQQKVTFCKNKHQAKNSSWAAQLHSVSDCLCYQHALFLPVNLILIYTAVSITHVRPGVIISYFIQNVTWNWTNSIFVIILVSHCRCNESQWHTHSLLCSSRPHNSNIFAIL